MNEKINRIMKPFYANINIYVLYQDRYNIVYEA